jgi:hypothetical protein
MGSFAANTAEIQPPVPQTTYLIGYLDFIFCENSSEQEKIIPLGSIASRGTVNRISQFLNP